MNFSSRKVHSSLAKTMRSISILLFLTASQTSAQSLKFLIRGQEDSDPSAFPILKMSTPTLDRGLRSVTRACVTGKWIFYTAAHYGIGLENNKNVQGIAFPTAMSNTTDAKCHSLDDEGITMADIRSILLISPSIPKSAASLLIFSEANYLGPTKKVSRGAKSEIRMGSFIYTRGYSREALYTWELCSSNDCTTGDNVCVDQRFLNPGHNVSNAFTDAITVNLDNPADPIQWPRIIRTVRYHAHPGLCGNTSQHAGSKQNTTNNGNTNIF